MEDRCISEEFIRNLSPHDTEAWGQILEMLRAVPLDRDSYPHLYGFLLSFAGARGLPVEVPYPTFEPEHDLLQLADMICALEEHLGPTLNRQRIENAFEQSRDFYQARIAGAFVYAFPDGDYRRLVTLVARIGGLARENQHIDANHKQRLLQKIEGLQRRLLHRMSSLDMLWSLVGEAGVVLGKLGVEAMPLAEGMCEIIRITMRVHARAEGLTPATENPLLSEAAQGNNAHGRLKLIDTSGKMASPA